MKDLNRQRPAAAEASYDRIQLPKTRSVQVSNDETSLNSLTMKGDDLEIDSSYAALLPYAKLQYPSTTEIT